MKPFLQKNSNKPRFEFPPMGKKRRNKGSDSSSSSDEGFLLPARGIWTISDPNQNDVLCGRSDRINAHPGNLQFKEIVAASRDRYMLKGTKRSEKVTITTLIVQKIRSMDPSGRFLKEDPKTGLWFDIGDVKAIKKVGQELRKSSGSNSLPDPCCESVNSQSISSGLVPQTDNHHNNNNQRNHKKPNENDLNHDDFPVGRPYPFHPKIKLLNQMVEELLPEYTEADKISKRTLDNGQELRSRHELINLVVQSLTSGKGKFKKKQKDGSWVVDNNYSEVKLRTRIVNTFNTSRDKHTDTQSAQSVKSTTSGKMTIVTESTKSVTIDSHSAASMSNSKTRTAPSIQHGMNSISMYNHNYARQGSNSIFQQPPTTADRTNDDESIEQGGKIVFDQVWEQISSQYDTCHDHSTVSNFDLPFSKEELAPDIRMLDDISQTKARPPVFPNPTNTKCQKMDGVEPMEFDFGRLFEPVEETMSVSDVSGLSSAVQSASTMSTISGMRSTISGMRSNLTGLRSNISGFTSNAESSNMGGRSRTSLTLASVFSTGKTHETHLKRKRKKKR